MKKTAPYLLFVGISLFISCGGDSEDDLICSESSLEISLLGTTEADCTTNGSLEVSVSGGTGSVEFDLDGAATQASGEFSASAGTYTVTATDEMGCISSIDVTVGAVPSKVVISDVISSFSGCGAEGGSIEIAATGGIGSLSYRLDNGDFKSEAMFTSLGSGTYTVTVSDEEGCDTSRSVEVLTGIRLSSDVMPIITANCQLNNSSCHSSGAPRVDLGVRSNIISRAADIRSRTQSGNMPRNGSLTQDEKDLIACWVDDGALNN